MRRKIYRLFQWVSLLASVLLALFAFTESPREIAWFIIGVLGAITWGYDLWKSYVEVPE